MVHLGSLDLHESWLVWSATLISLSILLYEVWRRGTERKTKIERKGRVLLPSPYRLLPDWCGNISGHTLRINLKRAVEQMEDWADEYGGDCELRLLRTRCIVVTDIVEMRRMLALRPIKFKRGMNSSMSWVGEATQVAPTMFFNEGSEWGRSRRIIAPTLNGQNVEDMIPAMSTVAENFCLRWERRADSGKVEDALDSTGRFAHDVICLAGLGLRANSVDKEKWQPSATFDGINTITAIMMKLMYSPFAPLIWKYLPSTSWVKESKRISSFLEGIVHAMVKKTRSIRTAEGQENGVDDVGTGRSRVGVDPSAKASSAYDGKILRKIVTAGERSTGDRMAFSDDDVVREIKSLFIAGTDTTGHSLAWALYFLTAHPEAHARCRREALEVAPLTKGVVWTPEQLSRLTFCSAVFMESLRLRPAATRIVLYSTEDYSMRNGLKAPKGTAFFLLTRRAAVSDETFTRGREFIPERWIEAEREEALLGKGIGDEERTVHHREEAFLAFGSGPRACPGQDMAKAEATIILAAACARFNFALAPGQLDPPKEVFSFTSGPDALNLVLTNA